MPIPIGDMPITDPFLAPILVTNTIKLGSSTMSAFQDPTPATLRETLFDIAQLSMIAGHWAVVIKDHEFLLSGNLNRSGGEQGIAMADVLFIYLPIFSRMVVDGWLFWYQDRTARQGLAFANDVATLSLLAARHGTSNSEAIHESFCRHMPTDPRCSSA
jgi:hypothetical protein